MAAQIKPIIPSLKLTENEDSYDLQKDINQIVFPDNPTVYPFVLNDLKFLKDVYLGQMNTVKSFFHKPTRNVVVAKITRLPTSDYKDEFKLRQFYIEIKAMSSVSQCPNIVTFYGLCIIDNFAYIFMEYMDSSLKEFYELVHQKNNIFPEKILSYVAISIVDALDFCSTKNIIHRDLKPGNVLLNKNGEIKLCDFGVSKITENTYTSTFVGTVAYWPPERFKKIKMKYDVRADIWSLGILLVEVALGKHPFTLLNEEALKSLSTIQDYILNFKKQEIITLLRNYSNDMQIFIEACLKKYDERPKSKKLKEMKLYTKNKPVNNEDIAKFVEEISKKKENLTFYETLVENPAINKIKFQKEDKSYKFKMEEFEKLESISNKVCKYLHKPSNKNMAIKFIPISQNQSAMDEINKQIITSLVNEIPSLFDLQHESSVLEFYGLCVYKEQILICMEFMDMTLKELNKDIHALQMLFPEQLLGCIVVTILNALISCKLCDILNHEIRPENIFINKNGQIKLACFDKSRYLKELFETVVLEESMFYWPPEKFQHDQDQNYDKSNIWAIGITLCELVNGVIPFLFEKQYLTIRAISDLKVKLKNLEVDKLIEETFSQNYSHMLREFVKLCLQPVQQRPRYNELRKTRFFRTYEFFEDAGQAYQSLQEIEAERNLIKNLKIND